MDSRVLPVQRRRLSIIFANFTALTILEHIQLANDAVGIPIKQFRFADLREFNAFNKSFTFENYPCHVMEPFSTGGLWLNGRTKTTVPLRGWILKRIPQDTVNFRTMDVEELHIKPMRDIAKAFIKNILSSDHAEDIVDPEVDAVQWSIKPEYGLIAEHLFGVSYTINLPVRESIC